eukprot:scaffold2206_cov316-Pavlova_lutheri.AAC.4
MVLSVIGEDGSTCMGVKLEIEASDARVGDPEPPIIRLHRYEKQHRGHSVDVGGRLVTNL